MGARAAADLVRPDLWQVTRTLGRAAPAAGDGSPLRRAREYELAGGRLAAERRSARDR